MTWHTLVADSSAVAARRSISACWQWHVARHWHVVVWLHSECEVQAEVNSCRHHRALSDNSTRRLTHWQTPQRVARRLRYATFTAAHTTVNTYTTTAIFYLPAKNETHYFLTVRWNYTILTEFLDHSKVNITVVKWHGGYQRDWNSGGQTANMKRERIMEDKDSATWVSW